MAMSIIMVVPIAMAMHMAMHMPMTMPMDMPMHGIAYGGYAYGPCLYYGMPMAMA